MKPLRATPALSCQTGIVTVGCRPAGLYRAKCFRCQRDFRGGVSLHDPAPRPGLEGAQARGVIAHGAPDSLSVRTFGCGSFLAARLCRLWRTISPSLLARADEVMR